MNWNPLFWLHIRLAGSWRSYAYLIGIYTALVLAGASISYRLAKTPSDHSSVTSAWLMILTAAQSAFLMLVIPSAVRRAVLRDFQTGMIESHRLTPMSNFKIILGYLTGPAAQGAALYLTSLALGAYFVNEYARSFGLTGMGPNVSVMTVAFGWYFLQICLLFLVFMVTTLTLLTAIASAGKANVLGLLVLVCVFGGWVIVPFVPGIALLTGVLSGDVFVSAFMGRKAMASGNLSDLALAALGQAALGGIFILAACRKIRSPERSMFSIPLGLVLLVIWGAVLIAGLSRTSLHPTVFRGNSFESLQAAQIVASTIAFVVMAQLPLIAAAVEAWHAHRAQAFGETGGAGRRFAVFMPLLLGALTLGVMVLMYGVIQKYCWTNAGDADERVIRAFQDRQRLAAMGAALLLCFWTDFQLLYVTVMRGRRVFWTVLLSAFLLKALPILLDFALMAFDEIREVNQAKNSTFEFYRFSGGSPVGTLILCIFSQTIPWAGLVFQAVIAVAATIWAARARRELAPRPARAVVAA